MEASGALAGEARLVEVLVGWTEVREPPELSSSAEFPPLPSRSLVGAGAPPQAVPGADSVFPQPAVSSFLVGRVEVALSPSDPSAAASPRDGRELGFQLSEMGFPSGWAGPVDLGGPAQRSQPVRSGGSSSVWSDSRHVGQGQSCTVGMEPDVWDVTAAGFAPISPVLKWWWRPVETLDSFLGFPAAA
jgi:hypothetical protein